jgi:hypothetical protein
MDILKMLLAADVDPNTELNMHRPSRAGNSGRFGDPLLSSGCTPLLRATMGNDMEVVQALLAKGASPKHQRHGYDGVPGGSGPWRRPRLWRQGGRKWRRQYTADGSASSAWRGCECSGHRHKELFHAWNRAASVAEIRALLRDSASRK